MLNHQLGFFIAPAFIHIRFLEQFLDFRHALSACLRNREPDKGATQEADQAMESKNPVKSNGSAQGREDLQAGKRRQIPVKKKDIWRLSSNGKTAMRTKSLQVGPLSVRKRRKVVNDVSKLPGRAFYNKHCYTSMIAFTI